MSKLPGVGLQKRRFMQCLEATKMARFDPFRFSAMGSESEENKLSPCPS